MSSTLQASLYLTVCREGVNVMSLILGQDPEWIHAVSAARREILGNPLQLDWISHSLELLLCWPCLLQTKKTWDFMLGFQKFPVTICTSTPVPLSYHSERCMTWRSMEPVVQWYLTFLQDQISLLYDPSKPIKFHQGVFFVSALTPFLVLCGELPPSEILQDLCSFTKRSTLKRLLLDWRKYWGILWFAAGKLKKRQEMSRLDDTENEPPHF